MLGPVVTSAAPLGVAHSAVRAAIFRPSPPASPHTHLSDVSPGYGTQKAVYLTVLQDLELQLPTSLTPRSLAHLPALQPQVLLPRLYAQLLSLPPCLPHILLRVRLSLAEPR